MILPVTVYGNPILRKISEPIDKNYDGLNDLVKNMFDTMYHAEGVGLAAPQIGLDIRIFVIDASPAATEEEPELKDYKKAFINPKILSTAGEMVIIEEGCLSLPNIHEDVTRPNTVTINYFDENWVEHTDTVSGYAARIIQHEYDHLDGKLFIDSVSVLRKRLIKSKLMNIAKGKTRPSYRTV